MAKRNFRQRHRHESAAAATAAVPRAAEIPKTQPVPPLASVAVDSQPPYALPDVSALILGSLASTGAVYPASVSAQQLAAVHSLADRRNENSDDSADDGDKKMAARSSDTERGADMEQEEGIIINSSCTEDSSEEEEEEEEEEEIRYASGADPRKFDLWMSILESRPSNFESDKLSAWLLQVCELSENPFDPMADEKAARLHNAIQNLSELPDNDNERERS